MKRRPPRRFTRHTLVSSLIEYRRTTGLHSISTRSCCCTTLARDCRLSPRLEPEAIYSLELRGETPLGVRSVPISGRDAFLWITSWCDAVRTAKLRGLRRNQECGVKSTGSNYHRLRFHDEQKYNTAAVETEHITRWCLYSTALFCVVINRSLLERGS